HVQSHVVHRLACGACYLLHILPLLRSHAVVAACDCHLRSSIRSLPGWQRSGKDSTSTALILYSCKSLIVCFGVTLCISCDCWEQQPTAGGGQVDQNATNTARMKNAMLQMQLKQAG